MNGNIIALNAEATPDQRIAINTNAILNGRALSQKEVTLQSATVTIQT